MMALLEQLSTHLQKYLSRLFCLPGSIVVTNRPGNDTPHGTGFRMVAGPSPPVQLRGVELQWHINQSLKVEVRVAEAAPPAGYLKLLQVLRKQI